MHPVSSHAPQFYSYSVSSNCLSFPTSLASTCHSPVLSSPSSFSPYGCHNHLLKLTSALVSLLPQNLLSSSVLLERNPNSSTRCEHCPGLAPRLAVYPCHSFGFSVTCFSFLTLHWVPSSCNFACALAHDSDSCPSPDFSKAHLVITSILESSTQIFHEESLVTSGENLSPSLRVTAPYYACLTILTAALTLVPALCLYSPHHLFHTYKVINWKEEWYPLAVAKKHIALNIVDNKKLFVVGTEFITVQRKNDYWKSDCLWGVVGVCGGLREGL